MIDHVTLYVKNYAVSKEFYASALKPLGYGCIMDLGDHGGFGADGKPDLWIVPTDEPLRPTHLAIAATDRAVVDAFHAAGLAAGGVDNGPPGIREDYHPNYYAAFIHDPDGNNIEAVCHRPL